MKKKLKVIDLFSGCGGLNEGFNDAGFQTSVSNDIWEPAGKTFLKNNTGAWHLLDNSDCVSIAVAPIPNHKLGKTINDRLKRASFTE